MTDHDHFVDSNIIIGYASDFEEIHDKCQEYFNRDIIKRTGIRVFTEVNRIKAQRRKLYLDLCNYSSTNMNIGEYKPSIPITRNLSNHLIDLLKELANNDISDVLSYLNRKIRTIEAGIKEALNKIVKPFIKLYNYFLLEMEIDKFIHNLDDSRILSDAVCWAEENDKIIFCTNDYKDYISNKEDIYYAICSIRSFEFREIPIEIVGIREVIL